MSGSTRFFIMNQKHIKKVLNELIQLNIISLEEGIRMWIDYQNRNNNEFDKDGMFKEGK